MFKDLQKRKEFSKFLKNARINECFYQGTEICNREIISAHSIQENGVLSIIEEKINDNNVLYSLMDLEKGDNGEIVRLLSIGKKKATTFRGFCKFHDQSIFEAIENCDFDSNSNKQCFLHTYRSFAKEMHTKKEILKGIKKLWESNNESKYYSIASELVSRDHNIVKNRLNEMLTNSKFDELEYLTNELNYVIPIACSSSITPKFYYNNELFNFSIREEDVYEQIFINIFPTAHKTHILLAALPEHKKAIKYLDVLEKLPELKFLKAISSILICETENTIVSPRILKKLGKSGLAQLLRELTLTEPGKKENHKSFFHSKLNFFDKRFAD